MKYPEKNILTRKENNRNRGDQKRTAADLNKSRPEMVPTDPVFVNQGKSDPYTNKENRYNKSRQPKPERVLKDINGYKIEKIEIEKQVKKDHQ